MNWQQITLGQFQDTHKIAKDTALDDLDRAAQVISILYGMTESEVDNLSVDKFNQLSKDCSQFLNQSDIPGKPVKSFMVGKRKYAINYRPTTLKHRQYVEILHFSDRPIENMHQIMASLVWPVKWGMRKENKAEDHNWIAVDMQNAPLIAVYHSCVFFCKIYHNLIERTQDYLTTEMMKQGATEKQAKKLLTGSLSVMAGFIQQSK